MKYKQYNLNGRVFNYMLAFERYGYEIELGGGQCRITMSEKELIALGAVPCGKCGERENKCTCSCHLPCNGKYDTCGCVLCDKDHQPKEEKIEQVVLNNIEEISKDGDYEVIVIIDAINQIIRNQKAIINKLNGDN